MFKKSSHICNTILLIFQKNKSCIYYIGTADEFFKNTGLDIILHA